ncbi:MAG TPA: aldo/keto reductase [Cellulomonas sp.]
MALPDGPLTKPGVPRVGLGLAALGRPAYITLGRATDLGDDRPVELMEARTHEVLDAAWDAGVRYLDAARSYGYSERFLGSWLAAHPERRTRLVVGTKWGYRYVAGWRMDVAVHEVKEHSPAMFDTQWPQTLAALGGAPDIENVHSVTPDSPALTDHELLARFRDLVAQGVRVGFSTSGPRQGDAIDAALAIPDSPFSVVQATWNALEPSSGAALGRAHDAGWFVVVKEAVANGRLTPDGDEPAHAALAEQDGQAPDALAIGWALAQPFVDLALSGAVTVDQLRSNLAARPPRTAPAAFAALAEPPERYWAERSALPWT